MQRLRKQARQLGDNSAASADDAAGAQIIIAKAGGDIAAIEALTPVTLNMSLANRKTMEENAALLMGMKSAFQLANDNVAHIGDVLSMTMNKTHTKFEGLSNALTYVAPVAKNAGISLEETAAMVGALHDANITGSMAGTGSRAVISRLQAPTGKAYAAISELGVKTLDSKGNTRPIFTLLKEIKRSFDKNKLGSGQRAEYMKAIFGEEASSSASVLISAAAIGKLDRLTALLAASDGKTEALVKVMQDTLGGDLKELESAREAVGIDVYDEQEGALRKLIQTATRYVLKLDKWIQKNRELANTIGVIAASILGIIGIIGAIGLIAWPVVTGINAIIAAASLLSTIFIPICTGIISAVGAISWPVLAVAAVVAGTATLIITYWKPLWRFFSAMGKGLKIELDLFVERVNTTINGVWLALKQGASAFMAPIKQMGAAIADFLHIGSDFGKALSDALLLPLNMLDKLRSNIDWALEKLGLVSKESLVLDETADRTNTVVQANKYVPVAPAHSNINGYKPIVKASAPAYVDQSKNDYHINLNNLTSDPVVEQRLQRALEKYEQEKRARSRAFFAAEG